LVKVPALGLEFKLLTVTTYEYMAVLLVSDVTDEANVLHLLHFLAVTYGNGKYQFIVFATIEGTGRDIHVHFFCHDSCLIVNREVLLEDTAADTRLLADVT
jgi:hypothetical protein